MSAPIQGLLDDIRPRSDSSRGRPQDRVADFEELLRRAGGWLLASQILIRCGLPIGEVNKRRLRALAARSQLILSGQRGYCHLDHASVEELHHAAAWMESQARQMQRRAIHLRQAAHRMIAA
jgi:hypothetical protein